MNHRITHHSIKTLFWCAATLRVVFSLMTGLSLFLEGVKGDAKTSLSKFSPNNGNQETG